MRLFRMAPKIEALCSFKLVSAFNATGRRVWFSEITKMVLSTHAANRHPSWVEFNSAQSMKIKSNWLLSFSRISRVLGESKNMTGLRVVLPAGKTDKDG